MQPGRTVRTQVKEHRKTGAPLLVLGDSVFEFGFSIT